MHSVAPTEVEEVVAAVEDILILAGGTLNATRHSYFSVG